LGSQLEECAYEQLLPFAANDAATIQSITPGARPFRVLTDSFVTTEDGTGIVHTAPAFGADDYKVGKKYGIGILTLVDREGKFIDGVGEFSGRYVKDYKSDPNYVDVNIEKRIALSRWRNTSMPIRIVGEPINPFSIIRWMPGSSAPRRCAIEWWS